ncbi:MAG: MATE family efflux transporter [Bacteroidales bacterium]|nr:MATE family efflux transporter [Bacteroidales bacterium]MBP5389368.1 MATE family efflux transporter [Bacteroidales bacterium]
MATGAGAAPTQLGTLEIGKLLKMYAVPGIIAQTAASLYNIVDSIYIGHIKDVGSFAISGLAVSFPLMNLSAALGTLVGVGAMTMISVMLGQKNYETAGKVLGNVLTLNTLIGIIFTVFSLLFLEPILRFFGASDNTLPFASQYMTIILLGNVFTHLYFGFNGILRAAGHPKTAMGLTLFTVTSNAILDPIFIFGFKMGIQGAAVATILCQMMALSYSFRFFLDKNSFLHFPRPLFQLDWRIAKSSLSIGLGPFLMNAAACIVAIFINQQLGRYGGDLAIGAYGIINRITFIFIMVVMGFTQGMQPIAGYNYGARLYSRVREIFVLTAKWAVLVTTVCFLVSELIPGAAVGIFTNDPELRHLAAHGIRIMNAAVALVGFGIVASNLFQCLGMVKISIFLSLSRQLLFLVPLIYILPDFLAEKGVWLSFPISDTLSVIFSAFFIIRLFRKFARLRDGDEPDILGSNLQ